MRFQRISIERFGGLAGLDTGEEPLGPLVAVHGPNEGGKSSLFAFLTALLYGFYPASRDQNPHAPWGGGDIDGSATLRLSDGRIREVHRRLLAAPWGELEENGRVENIRNRNLDVARVPREVFLHVYALTLADLAGLEGASWEAVQDRLIGSMGAPDIVPPRVAAEALEEEAHALWRPTRRGTTRVSALEERLAGLRGRRSEALRKDREVRERVERLSRVRDALDEARREREAIRLLRERIETLLPVRRQLRRIAELREVAGSEEELESLPPDPDRRRAELEEATEAAQARLRRLEEEAVEPRARIAAATEEVERFLAHRDAIAALVSRSGEVAHAAAREIELRGRRRELERRAGEEARELFAVPWKEVEQEAVRAIPSATLRRGVRELREAAGRRAAAADAASGARQSGDRAGRPRATPDTAEVAEPDSADPDGDAGGTGPGAADAEAGGRGEEEERLRPLAGAALVALGVLLFVIARARDSAAPGEGLDGGEAAAGGIAPFLLDTLLPLLPAPLVLVGAMLLAGWWSRRGALAERRERDRTERRRREARLKEARAAEAAARRRVEELLGELPLRDEQRADAGPELVEGIARLQGLLHDLATVDDGLREVREHLDSVNAGLEAVRGPLERAELPADPARALPWLERELHHAEDIDRERRAAEREVARIERDRTELEEELERHAGELTELDRRLEALGAGDREVGARRAAERIAARETADRIRAELERTHPDVDTLRKRIEEAEAAGEPWTADDETRTRAALEEEDLSRRVEELGAEAEGLERDVAHMIGEETADAVDGAIAEAQEEIARLLRERDRRFVLARLLREADRRFRDEHQPDILRCAGRYMALITGGRYDRIAIAEEGGRPVFHLEPPGRGGMAPVEAPISTGTREQFYLALRLAIVDHLDADGERLPLFMDEAFVNWDEERRSSGFDLLEQLSRERQIFVFTCHEAMAAELESRGARVLRLGERL